MTLSRDGAILAGILLMATLLRVWGINAPLWYDEITTLETHLRLNWPQMLDGYEMNHHYFYSFQAKFFVDLFGDAPWVIRLPALIFGVGTVWMIWILARDISDKMIAHAAGLLAALSYHEIWFSQNARGYTEMAFWGTLGTILFLRLVVQSNGRVWIAYALVVVAAIFTHLTSAFIFVAHGLVWLWLLGFGKAPFRGPFLGFLGGGLLTLLVYAPLLPSLVQTMGGVSDTSAVDVMQEYQNPIWTVIEGATTAIGSAGPLVGLVVLAVLVVMLAGAYATRANGRIFAWIFLLHLLVTIAALLALSMRIWPRFFFLDIGFAMILIVLGVRQFSEWIGAVLPPALSPGRIFAVGVVAMCVLSAGLAYRNYAAPKQNLAGAVEFVRAQRPDAAPVYAVAHSTVAFNSHFDAGWTRLDSNEDFVAALQRPGPMTLVVVFPARALRTLPDLEAGNHDLDLLHAFPGTLGDGFVLVYGRG